jgi:alkylation response protein AidB-like acyl-CoA dehydrogenase
VSTVELAPYYPIEPPLSDELSRLVQLVERLGREKIGPRAARYDREASNPIESWQDLWEAGLLQARVPTEYGGLGMDHFTFTVLLERLARHCAATAMTWHMHSNVVSFIDTLGTEAQKRRFFGPVVDEGQMLASWGSEPNVSINRAYLRDLTVTPHEGGYLVEGSKHFCTMAGAAEYAMLWGTMAGFESYAEGAIFALVRRDNPGLRIVSGWDTLGMRGTVSPSVVVERCYVEADDLLGQPGDLSRIAVTEYFGLGFAAVCLGIATGALQWTSEYCQTKTFKPDPLPIAHDVTVQRHIGEVAAGLDAARVLLLEIARRWCGMGKPERGVMASRAKFVAMQASLAAVDRCMQVIGGRGALKELPVERAYRDLRTSTLMPPNHDRMLEVLGRHELRLGSLIFNIA